MTKYSNEWISAFYLRNKETPDNIRNFAKAGKLPNTETLDCLLRFAVLKPENGHVLLEALADSGIKPDEKTLSSMFRTAASLRNNDVLKFMIEKDWLPKEDIYAYTTHYKLSVMILADMANKPQGSRIYGLMNNPFSVYNPNRIATTMGLIEDAWKKQYPNAKPIAML